MINYSGKRSGKLVLVRRVPNSKGYWVAVCVTAGLRSRFGLLDLSMKATRLAVAVLILYWLTVSLIPEPIIAGNP